MSLSFPISCRVLLFFAVSLLASRSTAATPVPDIAPAINSLGLDLYREQIKSSGDSSILLSPYSIATALAMTYAGADGVTKAEMEKILYFSPTKMPPAQRLNSSPTNSQMLSVSRRATPPKCVTRAATPPPFS